MCKELCGKIEKSLGNVEMQVSLQGWGWPGGAAALSGVPGEGAEPGCSPDISQLGIQSRADAAGLA